MPATDQRDHGGFQVVKFNQSFHRSIRTSLAAFVLSFLTTCVAFAAEEVTLTAPREASAGAEIEVSYEGSTAALDFISIDEQGSHRPRLRPVRLTKLGRSSPPPGTRA